jgi:hypothetical protein
MNFFQQATQCDPLGPVPSGKELDAAKAMEQITKGQGNPVSPHPVNPQHPHGGNFIVGDFTAPRITQELYAAHPRNAVGGAIAEHHFSCMAPENGVSRA